MPVLACSEVQGLQQCLDDLEAAIGAIPAGISLQDLTWANIANKPATFSPSAHNHDGVYALANHTHPGGGSDPWVWAKLGADVSNSTVTLATSGLTFTATANTTYIVRLNGTFQAAATTTGIAMALDIPSGAVSGTWYHNTSATATGAGEQIADNATTGVTTGVRAAATNVPVGGEWIVAIGATGGTVTLTFRSEVASSAVTLKANLTALGARAI